MFDKAWNLKNCDNLLKFYRFRSNQMNRLFVTIYPFYRYEKEKDLKRRYILHMEM